MNQYALDALVRLTETFYDSTGALVDPATITLTVTDPNGVRTTYTLAGAQIIRDSLGVYHFYVDTSGKPGIWYYHWDSTGPQEASEGSFEVLSSPALGKNILVCSVGQVAPEDVVAYVRGMLGDTDETNFAVSDAVYRSWLQDVALDYSRFVPLDFPIGNWSSNTSPLVSVAGRQRYVISASTVAGLPEPVLSIQEALWINGTGMSAISDIAYYALLPFSPSNIFLFAPNLLDAPSRRIERDQYLNELEHYGKGRIEIRRDQATGGKWALDLYPIPQASGLPIYARVQTPHKQTGSFPNLAYATVPDEHIRLFKDLLHAKAKDLYANLAETETLAKAGMTEIQQSPESMRREARRLREGAYGELGGDSGVGIVGS